MHQQDELAAAERKEDGQAYGCESERCGLGNAHDVECAQGARDTSIEEAGAVAGVLHAPHLTLIVEKPEIIAIIRKTSRT
jgi:hypothetical protein